MSTHPAWQWSEARLLFKSGAPEAPPEGGEKKKEKKEKKDEGDTVKKETEKTKDAVRNVVPQVEEQPCPQPEAPHKGPQYVQSPPVADALRHARNALITALGIALPPLGIAALAGGGATRYLASKTTDHPLSMGQAAKDTFIHAPKAGLKSLGKTLLFPFRWVGAKGVNTLKFTGDKLHHVLDATVFELYRDMKAAVNHKFDFPKDTNLLASAMIGVKRALFFPKDIAIWYLKTLQAHPKSTIAATIAIPWITMHGGWPAVFSWAGDMSQTLLEIFKGAATKMTIPVVP